MFIHELGRTLTGRLLAIWEGRSGLSAEKESAYRALWLDRSRGDPAPQLTERCAHIGAAVRGAEAPDLQRDWHRCDHPKRVEFGIAEVVCSCRGCNAKCEGYE